MFDCTQAKNLKLSFDLLSFWCEFKTTLENSLENEIKKPEWGFLVEPYLQIVNALLVQCKRSQFSIENFSELEEIEAAERGMSVAKYREHAQDVFFKSYSILKKVGGDEGKRILLQSLVACINKSQQDAHLFESGIFAIKCLLDGFEKTSSPTLMSEFLRTAFESILQSPHV